MKIRRFTPADLSAIVQIQREVLPVGGWAESDYLRLSQQPGALLLLAETGGETSPRIAGYAVAVQTAGQAEILSLAVAGFYQRQGIGRELVDQVCAELQRQGAQRTFLEVRASNRPAINLYTSAGFTLHYVRSNYYAQPVEDAHVMCLKSVVMPQFRTRM